MLGSFRFKHFKDKILLTNDAGEYCFLSASEWKELSCRKLPITKSKELVTKHFWIPGDMENIYEVQLIRFKIITLIFSNRQVSLFLP